MLEDLSGLQELDFIRDQQEPGAQLTELLQQQLYDNAEYLVATYQVCILCTVLGALICVSKPCACHAVLLEMLILCVGNQQAA